MKWSARLFMLTRTQTAAIAAIVGAVILYMGLRLGLWSMNDVNLVILYIIGTSIAGALGWGLGDPIRRRFEKKPQDMETHPLPSVPDVNKNFNLSVIYLRRKGFPDSPEYTLKRYIANADTRWVFPIRELPEWLASDIIEHKIDWRGFSDTKNLENFLTDKGYMKARAEPSREQLQAQTLEVWKVKAIISDVRQRQLKDLCSLESLEVRSLTRRYFTSVVKRVLIIYSPNDGSKAQAWLAPSYVYALVKEGLIEEQRKNMKFWQSCSCWARANGYTFVDRCYPIITLLSKRS